MILMMEADGTRFFVFEVFLFVFEGRAKKEQRRMENGE